MKLIQLFVTLVACLALAQCQTVGDTLSCFSGFQKIETEGCVRRVEAADGSYTQEATAEIQDMDFCLSGPVYGPAKQGSYGKSKKYLASATFKMTNLGKYSTSYGFLGFAFNMIDTENYDIAYVRPHAKNHCWELGYVENGLLFGRDFGTCVGSTGKEFQLGVLVEKGQGEIHVNGAKVASFSPYFPAVNRVATAMRNNMVAEMTVRDLKVCQEMNCVSRNKAGETIVTKPRDSYQDQGMSKCEACTCQLYGQIKCGCRSAEDQGISCTGNMVPATGQDCCARCVPPFAVCTASGDPHYRSFDGRAFDFQGRCTYCVAKTNDFEIRNKNYPAGSVAINDYCQLLFDGDMIQLRGGQLQLTPEGEGNRVVATPFKKYYKTEDYLYCPEPSNCYIYLNNQKMMQLTCSRGYFKIWVHGTYYEKTKCMCGLWDGNSGNDADWGTSWMVANNDGCPNPPEPTDPCDSASRETKNWAEQFCAKYKQEPFRSCTVDVTSYFEGCLFDVCSFPDNDDNVCENALAYADACAKAGQPVEGWRSRTFCPLDCDDTFMYESCGRGCNPTCEDPSPAECVDTCVEGCYCPQGTVLQGGKCIDAADCRCMFEGSFFDTDASWNVTARCETCTCTSGGIIECDPLSCHECPEGQAPISRSGECCPICLADWIWEEQEKIEVTEGEGPVVLHCELHDYVLVSPDDITWKDGEGNVISADSLPDNMHFDKHTLKLTINPAATADQGSYTAEIVYDGVVGTCDFELTVNQYTVQIIDIDGESPQSVPEGECVTLKVKVVSESELGLGAEDFVWSHTHIGEEKEVAVGGRIKKTNGGKHIEICDAEPSDEGSYQCCVTDCDSAGDCVTDCAEVELQVLAVCDTDEDHYTEGDIWMDGDYKSCTCSEAGEAECVCVYQELVCEEDEEGYYDEECQQHCSRVPGSCVVSGDPHYKSWDGQRHDFQGGSCRFVLVKTSDFEVVGTNVHRNDNQEVSWNDAVQVFFEGTDFFIGSSTRDPGMVTVDGEDVNLPYNKIWKKAKRSISIIQAGDSVVLTIDLGNDLEAMSLTWDGNSTVSTEIHGKYFEGTEGLCGSWNDNVEDDIDNDNLLEGWTHKYTEGDEQCEEEPPQKHPCDDTFFPDAKPIADQACDVLSGAPFAACHGTIAVDAALHNCKYDTCSCYDQSCACHAIKNYVKECQEAGVAGLDVWRESASYCPLPCLEPLTYNSCGSFCPPTCADKTPECGKLAGKCNEGCFCPSNTFLQDGECVEPGQCKCEVEGAFKEVGDIWSNENTCTECQCMPEGELFCAPLRCDKCGKEQQEFYENADDCCPTCVTEWLYADPAEHLEVPQFTDLTLTCTAVVPPFKVEWFFTPVDGTEHKLEGGRKSLTYTITNISPEHQGSYRCEAKKNYKTMSASITVTTAGKLTSCTAAAPENGKVTPAEVEIGGVVTYSCDDGFSVNGVATSTCKEDGTIAQIPDCDAIEEVKFNEPNTAKPNKKGVATLTCGTSDTSFNNKSDIKFYFVAEDGTRAPVPGTIKYKKKGSSITFTVSGVSVAGMPSTVVCEGPNGDGTKKATGTINIL